MEQEELFFIHCWWECKMIQIFWKTVWQFAKLNILLSYEPAITLLGICSKEIKTYTHTKTCTQTSIAYLFIIAKTWKQPQCPLGGEWKHKLWYIYTMGYYSAIRNELSSHEKTCRTLKCILLSERSQSEKCTYCMIQLYNILRKAKVLRQQKDLSGRQELGRQRDKQAEHRVYLGQWNCSVCTVCTIMMETHHYIFVKVTERMDNTKNEP